MIVARRDALRGALALRVASFYKHESCGQCSRAARARAGWSSLLEKIEVGPAEHADLDSLRNVCDACSGKSLCALGDFARLPVPATSIKRYRGEFEAHIDQGGWPSAASRRSRASSRRAARTSHAACATGAGMIASSVATVTVGSTGAS